MSLELWSSALTLGIETVTHRLSTAGSAFAMRATAASTVMRYGLKCIVKEVG